ncbi:MAG: PEP-CTERM sorting domain-containing protein [Verrucomicrobiia bacterium]
MKPRALRWVIAAAMVAGVMSTQAAPWLGLVKTGTTSQNSDTIFLGTLTFSMDLRANTDGNPVGALQYYIVTSPANAVTYGTTPLTALNNPFVAADMTGLGQPPTAGATVNSDFAANTVWFKASEPDYSAFSDQSIGTYQFNVSSLAMGSYVFTPVGTVLAYGSVEINTFATPGSFELIVVPEPGTWTLLACGGLMAAWRNRRRSSR